MRSRLRSRSASATADWMVNISLDAPLLDVLPVPVTHVQTDTALFYAPTLFQWRISWSKIGDTKRASTISRRSITNSGMAPTLSS